jgi:hypothetical protein
MTEDHPLLEAAVAGLAALGLSQQYRVTGIEFMDAGWLAKLVRLRDSEVVRVLISRPHIGQSMAEAIEAFTDAMQHAITNRGV